jgi:hypothetical protein
MMLVCKKKLIGVRREVNFLGLNCIDKVGGCQGERESPGAVRSYHLFR